MNKNRSGRVKRGFTLIELLAVIVILAVIALIAVPVILSLVDKSRRKAAEESAVLYVDTIENMLMLNNVENTDGKTYKVKGRTVVDENDKVILNLEIKGDVPYNGVENVIKINSGFIEEANLRFNSYYVHYEMDMTTKKFKTCTSQKGFLDKCDGTGEVKPSEPEGPKGDGPTIEMAQDKTYLATVYLDPTDISRKCTKEEADANVNEKGTPTGIKRGCMKWYAYKDDGTNYTMILDHNTTVGVLGSEQVGATEVVERFNKDVESWETIIKNTARSIYADEVAEITGANREDTIKWNASKKYSSSNVIDIDTEVSSFYFDGSGSTYDGWKNQVVSHSGESKYAWLYDYTDCINGSIEYGCSIADSHTYFETYSSIPPCPNNTCAGYIHLYYYWTSDIFNGGWENGYLLSRYGHLTHVVPSSPIYAGIRPVITVSKSIFESKEIAKPKGELEEKLKIGDYISYIPENTSYTIKKEDTYYSADQTIRPSELNLWRVIRKNVDGTVDIVSEYISSNQIHIGTNTSKEIAYQNYIDILNKIASSYETEEYTITSRHTGYDNTQALGVLPNTNSSLDNGYIVDMDLIKEAVGFITARRAGTTQYLGYWLASRDATTTGRVLNNSGGFTSFHLNGYCTYVRPIVVLRADLKILSGNGQEDAPYQLKL